MFRVIGTDTYLKGIDKLPKEYKETAHKIPKRLAENPLTGTPLSYPFLRESRIKEKRIYYLVYEDLKLVLLVAVSGKKNQQATIDHVKEHLAKFKKIAADIAKKVS